MLPYGVFFMYVFFAEGVAATALGTKGSSSISPTRSSSASSSSVVPTTYLVYPVDDASRTQLDSIADTLNKALGTDKSAEMALDDTHSIFVAQMDATTAANLPKMNPAINSTALDASADMFDDNAANPTCDTGTDNQLRKREPAELDYQDPAEPELRFVSQPQNPYVSNFDTKDYAYDTTAGKNITVYVVDTGMNMKNTEISKSAKAAGGYRWLWPQSSFWNKLLFQVEDDPFGHGSCVISKISGFQFGIAKLATIVAVKLQYDTSPNGLVVKVKDSSILESLSLVATDIEDRKLQGMAVLNLNWGIPAGDRDFNAAFVKILERLVVDLDVVIVTTTGNDRKKYDSVSRYPERFAGQRPALANMIVVGAVYVDGSRTVYSQGGPLMDISAPGSVDSKTGIKCASGEGDTTVRKMGTSYAAPAVAGLAAYVMSINSSLTGKGAPAKVKAHLKRLSWSRNGGPPALWNGEESHRIANTASSRRKRAVEARADADASGSCPNEEGSGSSDSPANATPSTASSSAPIPASNTRSASTSIDTVTSC